MSLDKNFHKLISQVGKIFNSAAVVIADSYEDKTEYRVFQLSNKKGDFTIVGNGNLGYLETLPSEIPILLQITGDHVLSVGHVEGVELQDFVQERFPGLELRRFSVFQFDRNIDLVDNEVISGIASDIKRPIYFIDAGFVYLISVLNLLNELKGDYSFLGRGYLLENMSLAVKPSKGSLMGLSNLEEKLAYSVFSNFLRGETERIAQVNYQPAYYNRRFRWLWHRIRNGCIILVLGILLLCAFQGFKWNIKNNHLNGISNLERQKSRRIDVLKSEIRSSELLLTQFEPFVRKENVDRHLKTLINLLPPQMVLKEFVAFPWEDDLRGQKNNVIRMIEVEGYAQNYEAIDNYADNIFALGIYEEVIIGDVKTHQGIHGDYFKLYIQVE